MYKKFIFPLQIFIILEKINVNLFSSEKNYYNNYNIFTNRKNLLNINYVLKKEIFLNDSFLLENSAIDLKYYNNINSNFFNFFKKNKFLTFYNYNINFSKVKLIFYYFLNNNDKLISIDKFYLNANWIERETSEMYGIKFNNKKDCRKLMLDYSSFETPLVKDFPLEGNKQLFFSFFENQVVVQNNKYIEL